MTAYPAGMINKFKKVEVRSPPRMTTDKGARISFPGLSPFMMIGITASAAVKAVIRIGTSLYIEPVTIASCSGLFSISINRW